MLRPGEVQRMSVAGFKRQIGPHDVREKKDGPAICPIEVDWDARRCECPKFKGVAGERHRAQHSVLRSAAMVCLDIDEHPREVIDGALDAMERDGLNFSAWSSHSYGASHKLGKCPVRIIVYATHGVAPELIGPARKGLATRYGLKVDENTLTAITLFYLPACAAERRHLAFIRHSKATGLLNPDSLTSEADKLAAGKKAATRLTVRDETKFSGPRHTATRADLEDMTSHLKCGPVARAVLEGRSWAEEGNRHTAMVEFTAALAAHVESTTGLLIDPEGSSLLFARSCEVVTAEGVGSPTDCEWVAGLIRSAVTKFGSREPEREEAGVARLKEQLALAAKDPWVEVSADEACVRVAQTIREHEAGKIVVVVVPPGTGKSHALRKVAAERDRGALKTVIAMPNHRLIAEFADKFWQEHRTPARHYRGITAEIPGKAICANLIEAKRLMRIGLSSREICERCPFRSGCEVRRELAEQSASEANTQLTPRELVEVVLSKRPEALLVVDEDVPIHTRLRVDFDDLLWARNELQAGRRHGARLEGIHLLRQILNELALGKELSEHACRSAQQLPEWVSPDAAADLENSETLRMLNVLRVARACANRTPTWINGKGAQAIEVAIVTPVIQQLLARGGVVLTATPNTPFWEAAGAEIVRLAVPDAHPTTRQILYMADGIKKKMAPEGQVNAPLVEKMARDLLRLAPAHVRKVLVVTLKAVREHLATVDLSDAFAGEIQFAHYGAVEGLDEFKDCDGLVTLGDANPAEEQLRDLKAVGVGDVDGLKRAAAVLAAGSLAQAHGRLRDPRRANGAWHIHGGAKVPGGWHSDNTEVLRLNKGRKPSVPSQEALDQLEALIGLLGGQRALARELSVPPNHVGEWRKGSRPIPSDRAAKIANLFAST